MSYSPLAKELFEHAKHDAPSAASRQAMWNGVQTTTAASAVVAAKGFGLLSAKVIMGVALGMSLAAGIAALTLTLTRTHDAAPTSQQTRQIEVVAPITPRVVAAEPRQAITAVDPIEVVDAKVAPKAPVVQAAVPQLSEQDRLAREARAVREAQGALRRGEPEIALRLVRAQRRTAGARLIPEELTVETQALRAMGDEVGARHAEAELAKYH